MCNKKRKKKVYFHGSLHVLKGALERKDLTGFVTCSFQSSKSWESSGNAMGRAPLYQCSSSTHRSYWDKLHPCLLSVITLSHFIFSFYQDGQTSCINNCPVQSSFDTECSLTGSCWGQLEVSVSITNRTEMLSLALAQTYFFLGTECKESPGKKRRPV